MTDDGAAAFRARLAASIEAKGESQAGVARAAAVSRSLVNAYLKGRRTPSLATTLDIAAHFGWSRDDVQAWFGLSSPSQEPGAGGAKVLTLRDRVKNRIDTFGDEDLAAVMDALNDLEHRLRHPGEQRGAGTHDREQGR